MVRAGGPTRFWPDYFSWENYLNFSENEFLFFCLSGFAECIQAQNRGFLPRLGQDCYRTSRARRNCMVFFVTKS
jgi:hypothetical protein